MQKCRTLNGDRSVRHCAKRVKSAERTKLTKQIKRTKRKQGEATNRQRQTDYRSERQRTHVGTNLRAEQLPGIVRLRCSHSWQVSPYDSGGRFRRLVGGRQGPVSASVQGHPEHAVRRNRAGDDAVGTHAFKTHVGGLARRVGIQIGECPIELLRASSPTMDWSWMLRPISYVSLPVQNSAA